MNPGHNLHTHFFIFPLILSFHLMYRFPNLSPFFEFSSQNFVRFSLLTFLYHHPNSTRITLPSTCVTLPSTNSTSTITDKAIPVQAWTSSLGSSRLWLPEFLHNLHMKVAGLSAHCTGCLYPPQDIPVTHFC